MLCQILLPQAALLNLDLTCTLTSDLQRVYGQTMANSQQQEAVDLHNQKRTALGASNLMWDANLANRAQNWANRCAQMNRGQHDNSLMSGRVGGRGIGENIFYGTTSATNVLTEATKNWLSEEHRYMRTPDWSASKFSPAWGSWGHFGKYNEG